MDEPSCSRCQELLTRVAELEARIRDLEARLGRNATNSSIPPSTNPPDAPPPVRKKPTGRKPGGQPGHPPHLRTRLPPERVNNIQTYIPTLCESCQAALPAEAGPGDPEPRWHQVLELPLQPVEVTEYQAHGRTCACCGHLTWETIPQEIRAHLCGPRLTATIAFFSGALHLSKRKIEETLETVLDAPIALGTVCKLEQEMSAALAPAYAEAQKAVQEAETKNVDETGWKQAGDKRWLWGVATRLVACFVIASTRGALGLAALLGKKIKGILMTDRWSVYGQLKLAQRQLCWAHLKRDFQKLVDRGGAAVDVGNAGLEAVEVLFDLWHQFRGGGLTREQLRRKMAPVRQTLREWLELGCACADGKAAAFCANLLALEPALWTYLRRAGVEPTNNHIERCLRSGVLWRKNAFGCHSETGCRFVERILTVVQTLRLQKRPVLNFLHQSLLAHRQAEKPPQLVLQP
jgi:transposase